MGLKKALYLGNGLLLGAIFVQVLSRL